MHLKLLLFATVTQLWQPSRTAVEGKQGASHLSHNVSMFSTWLFCFFIVDLMLPCLHSASVQTNIKTFPDDIQVFFFLSVGLCFVFLERGENSLVFYSLNFNILDLGDCQIPSKICH